MRGERKTSHVGTITSAGVSQHEMTLSNLLTLAALRVTRINLLVKTLRKQKNETCVCVCVGGRGNGDTKTETGSPCNIFAAPL